MQLFYLLLFILLLCLLSPGVNAQERSLLDKSDQFRPVYSTTLSGWVSPDTPLRIGIDIRDDMTAFARIFAYGPEGTDTDWTLVVGKGKEIMQDSDRQISTLSRYPLIVTLKDRSGKYIMAEPGNYTAELSCASTPGQATVTVAYIYHGENLDKGNIINQSWSEKEVTIPDGLAEVWFVTESVLGTDLDLFVHNSTSLPDSPDEFTWISADSSSNSGIYGIDNFVPEMLVINDPQPGTYVMITRASGGDDYFLTYWMGFEKDPRGEGDQKIPLNPGEPIS